MRKEIIRTKIKEIEKNIRDFYDFIPMASLWGWKS